MTKRFFIDVEDITQENAVFEDGNCYCFEDDSEALVERLNELADENEQLKQTIDGLTLDNTKQKKVLNATKKENKQLKQQLDYADDLIHSHLSEHFIRQWTNFKMGHKEYNDFWEEKLKKYNELER